MLKQFRLIEIEIHNYCNRKCLWCPNQKYPKKHKQILDQTIYLKLLNELKQSGFEGYISYSRYNEPFYDIDLFKLRTKQAKKILPNNICVTNTNGDFLLKQNLKDLNIDELTIMDYDCKGRSLCCSLMKQAGIKIEHIEKNFIYGKYNDMKVLYYINWPKNSDIIDRGGLLNHIEEKISWKNDKKQRNRPCFEPKYFIGIDYNGNVMPCCNLHSDNLLHKDFILGNVKNMDLNSILSSVKAVNFRNTLNSAKNIPFAKPCTFCQKDPGRYTRKTPGIWYKEGINKK